MICAASCRAASSRSSASLRDWAVISGPVSWARWRMPETSSPTRSSARRTAASGERVACSSATSWLVLCTYASTAIAVVAAQDDREVDVGHDRHRIVGQGGQRRGDLLHQRVFGGG